MRVGGDTIGALCIKLHRHIPSPATAAKTSRRAAGDGARRRLEREERSSVLAAAISSDCAAAARLSARDRLCGTQRSTRPTHAVEEALASDTSSKDRRIGLAGGQFTEGYLW